MKLKVIFAKFFRTIKIWIKKISCCNSDCMVSNCCNDNKEIN